MLTDYRKHVTDPIDGLDMVLSTNDPMDRFVTVQNDNGVITLSLPFSANTRTPRSRSDMRRPSTAFEA